MATTPCTIVVFTEDRLHFPINSALIVMRQLFQYGVRDISIKGHDKIFISLSYSPKEKTLKKKFGNLPLRYMRTKMENEQEFVVLERVVKRFKFNLVNDENVEDLDALPSIQKKRYLEAPRWNDDDDCNLDEADAPPSSKRMRIDVPHWDDDLCEVINTPGTSSTTDVIYDKERNIN